MSFSVGFVQVKLLLNTATLHLFQKKLISTLWLDNIHTATYGMYAHCIINIQHRLHLRCSRTGFVLTVP